MCGTYRANTSCVQIEAVNEEIILCDAGTGISDFALAQPKDTPPQTYHIFISHLHCDHIQGFPFFSPAYIPGNRIIIHGFHKETEAALRAQMAAPYFPVPFESQIYYYLMSLQIIWISKLLFGLRIILLSIQRLIL